MNYAICIRKEASMCGATFTADSDFNVSVYNSTLNCSNDYLSFGTARKCGRILKEELNTVRLGKKYIDSFIFKLCKIINYEKIQYVLYTTICNNKNF